MKKKKTKTSKQNKNAGNLQRNTHMSLSIFQSRILRSQEKVGWYIPSVERENCPSRILSFRYEWKIKTSPDQQILRELNTSRPALLETLKRVIQGEMKACQLISWKYTVHW